MRLAVASYDVLPAGGGKPERNEWTTAHEPAQLWEWIDKRTKSKTRTIAFAHNLAYDLRVTDGIAQLSRLGWERMFLAVDGTRICARYRKGSRSLALVDSYSFMPASLADIAGRLGMRKLPLPHWEDELDEWEHYCRNDVEITRAAVLYVLGWLERNNCGMFRLTGPAQGMACFRHRFLKPGALLVHRDPDALAAERQAAWAGRCEAFKHGELAGPLYEWDFTLAYLTLARKLGLPAQLWAEPEKLTIRQLRQLATRRRVLAEVDVVTDAPLLPTEANGGIAWPVGSFTTTAWDNELIAAFERGARIEVRRAWAYKAKPVLAEWADWLYSLLRPEGLPAGCPERLMLKAWARSLIGRFGMRVPTWELIGDLETPSLRYLPSIDADTGEQGAILELENKWYERSGLRDAADAMPAVLSYVMAAARVRLLKTIEVAGWETVAYVDTDSLIVDKVGNARLEHTYSPDVLDGLRVKAEYQRVHIYGPRQLVLDGKPRVAGLPSGAIRRGKQTYDAELWESLAGTLRRGKTAEVRIQRRTITLKGRDSRRRHLAGGATAPLRLSA